MPGIVQVDDEGVEPERGEGNNILVGVGLVGELAHMWLAAHILAFGHVPRNVWRLQVSGGLHPWTPNVALVAPLFEMASYFRHIYDLQED